MHTTSLFNIIRSELQKKGFNEIIDEDGNLIFFDEDFQFMTKILGYDEDIKEIMNELFLDHELENKAFDQSFKKMFLYRFINRQINRQTKESFQMQLIYTFHIHQDFLNRLANDLDQYLMNASENIQKNEQVTDGKTVSDNRSLRAELPQDMFNIDVDDDIVHSADENNVSKNKQVNNQKVDGVSTGTSKAYQLENLLQTHGILETVLDDFDRKCFLQFW